MKLTVFITLIFIAASASVALGQERYISPADEANLDKSFVEFRTELIAAAVWKMTVFDAGN